MALVAPHFVDRFVRLISPDVPPEDGDMQGTSRDSFELAMEQTIRLVPHELAITNLRQLEVGSVCSMLLVAHNAYLLWSEPPLEPLDWVLHALCYLRILFFFPRPRYWRRMHGMYRECLEQPTPQLLQERLSIILTDKQPLQQFLTYAFHCWLVLIPCIIYGGGVVTHLSQRLCTHWKACFAVLLLSRLLSFVMIVYLHSSSGIERGMTKQFLEKHTCTQRFVEPWDGRGEPECGICLVDYRENEIMRLLQCGHHFHASCADTWLQKHRNQCPFCRAVIGPAVVQHVQGLEELHED